MSTRKEGVALVGVGAAACAVCCAGPILGFLAAIGLASVAGALLFGVVGLVAVVMVGLLWHRRRRATTVHCRAGDAVTAVAVAAPAKPPIG